MISCGPPLITLFIVVVPLVDGIQHRDLSTGKPILSAPAFPGCPLHRGLGARRLGLPRRGLAARFGGGTDGAAGASLVGYPHRPIFPGTHKPGGLAADLAG